MSRSAVFLLIMTLVSLSVLWLGPELEGSASLVLKCAGGFFGLAFLAALMAGRRFRFDPVLR